MEPRADSQVRCAFCHAPAGPEARTCNACRAVTHVDCLAVHGGCPTLGCRKAPLVRARPRPLAPRRPPARLTAVTLSFFGLSLVAFGPERHLQVIGGMLVLVALLRLLWTLPWAQLAAYDLTARHLGRPVTSEVPPPREPPVLPVRSGALVSWSPMVAPRVSPVDGWLELADPSLAAQEATRALASTPGDPGQRLLLALAHEARGEALELQGLDAPRLTYAQDYGSSFS